MLEGYQRMKFTVYQQFSSKIMGPSWSKMARESRKMASSQKKSRWSQNFRVVQMVNPRLKRVKSHQMRQISAWMPISLIFQDSSEECSARSSSKPRQRVETKLPSMLKSLRKKGLPRIMLQKRLNALILPKMGMRIMAGYVIPCMQLMSGRKMWKISRNSTTSSMMPVFVQQLVFPQKERLMSLSIWTRTFSQTHPLALRQSSWMQSALVMPSLFSMQAAHIFPLSSLGTNFLIKLADFSLNLWILCS